MKESLTTLFNICKTLGLQYLALSKIGCGQNGLKCVTYDVWKVYNSVFQDGACALTPTQQDDKKKEVCRIFKQNKLQVIVNVKCKMLNFLYIALDLNSVTFM